MECIVTGAAGFIGSHLCERLLNEGCDVIGIDNLSVGRYDNIRHLEAFDGFDFYPLDIESADLSHHMQTADWVFHLAARADIVPSIEEPEEYHRTNVTGTMRVLEAARKARVKRFIYAASSSCYGIPAVYPTPEWELAKPQYPYALTKYLGEQYVLHWGQCYRLPVVSLRLFNVYGPRARTSGTYGAVFGVFLSQLFNSRPLTVVGDGNQARDFTYVTDVVDAFVKAAEHEICNVAMNVGTCQPQSINRLVELLGATSVEHIPDRPGEPRTTQADVNLIKQTLGWGANVSFEEGVRLMLKELPSFKDAPLWDKDSIAKATKTWFDVLS